MCVFKAAPGAAISSTMKWKMIRLELACSWQFPRGSAGRNYLIRLPLTEEGSIDASALEGHPLRATVRRYWPNQADMVGRLVHTPMGFAIQYESVPARQSEIMEPSRTGDQHLIKFGVDAIKPGNEVFMTEPDGNQVRYRIASLQ